MNDEEREKVELLVANERLERLAFEEWWAKVSGAENETLTHAAWRAWFARSVGRNVKG